MYTSSIQVERKLFFMFCFLFRRQEHYLTMMVLLVDSCSSFVRTLLFIYLFFLGFLLNFLFLLFFSFPFSWWSFAFVYLLAFPFSHFPYVGICAISKVYFVLFYYIFQFQMMVLCSCPGLKIAMMLDPLIFLGAPRDVRVKNFFFLVCSFCLLSCPFSWE